MGVTDPERHPSVFLAVTAIAEGGSVDVRGGLDGCSGRVVMLGPPVGVLLVDPIPGTLNHRGGCDRQAPLRCGAIGDWFVEVRDHDGSQQIVGSDHAGNGDVIVV